MERSSLLFLALLLFGSLTLPRQNSPRKIPTKLLTKFTSMSKLQENPPVIRRIQTVWLSPSLDRHSISSLLQKHFEDKDSSWWPERLRYKLANKSRESPPHARKLLPLYRILRCKLAKKYWKSPPQAGKKSHPKSLPQAEKTYHYRSDLYDEVHHRLMCSSLKPVIVRIGQPIGPVEGIKLGDKFRSMGELVAVGLHTSHDKRIVTEFYWGCCVAAVSIIDSIQYDDIEKSSVL
ncbi:hypothetical protein V6N13_002245 [Hibiscus sabdariffa]